MMTFSHGTWLLTIRFHDAWPKNKNPALVHWYSLDVRRGRSGRHWWNEERFGRRVRFLLPQAPSSSSSSSSSSSTSMGGSFFKNASSASTLARLQIVNVTRQDGGDYRCRVDFNSAPSRNFKYRLVVIGKEKAPPSSPQISYFIFDRELD